MNIIYLSILLINSLLGEITTPKYVANVVPKKMSAKTKKARFYYLLVPAVQKVHTELMLEYESTLVSITNGTDSHKIASLKQFYKVSTDEELLACLKPHPQSITLAQAAMESSWGTSRFFTEANNIFGMWSSNPNEPRVAAAEKRGGTKTIWLRKFESVQESVQAYYKLMAKGKAFKEFRALRLQTNDPYQLVQKLDNYSEIGAKYGEELAQVIKYNKLIKYDK